jgi:carboxyl-terminal processing protease
MTNRTRLSVLLISTPILAFIVLGNVMGRASDGDTTFQHLRVFEDVVSLILNNYVEDPKVDNVMEGAMRGLADSLDPRQRILTALESALAGGAGLCGACCRARPAPARPR